MRLVIQAEGKFVHYILDENIILNGIK